MWIVGLGRRRSLAFQTGYFTRGALAGIAALAPVLMASACGSRSGLGGPWGDESALVVPAGAAGSREPIGDGGSATVVHVGGAMGSGSWGSGGSTHTNAVGGTNQAAVGGTIVFGSGGITSWGGSPFVPGNGGPSGGAAPGGTAGSDAGAACGPLIDDLEGGDGEICSPSDRRGMWYACNDGSGTQWPEPTTPGVPILPERLPLPRGTSQYAMHSWGTPFTGWGVGIGVDLAFDGTRYWLYDASRYGGIRFWARSDTGDSVTVRIGTQSTTMPEFGGSCSASHCPPLESVVALTPEWREYQLSYLDFLGTPNDEWDRLTNIQFYPNQYLPFDFWIDDVSFITELPNCCAALPHCSGTIPYTDGDLAAQLPPMARTCAGACFVNSVHIDGAGVGSLQGLECLQGVSRVTLVGTQASDLAPLASLPSLVELAVSEQPIDTLEPFATSNLRHLALSRTALRDARSLDNLDSLRFLLLDDHSMDSWRIAGLDRLGSLTVVNVAANSFELSNLPSLESLELRGVAVPAVDLVALARLERVDASTLIAGRLVLAELPSLDGLTITDSVLPEVIAGPLPALQRLEVQASTLGASTAATLAGLKDLVGTLQTLTALACGITELEVGELPRTLHLAVSDNGLETVRLDHAEVLLSFDAAGNQLRTLEVIDAPSLQSLDVSSNPLAQLRIIGQSALQSLNVSGCALTDLRGLESLTGLRQLNANYNALEDIAVLRNAPALRYIELTGNQLTSVSPFLDFLGLQATATESAWARLDVRGNPIDCLADADAIQRLQSMYVSVITDCVSQ